MKLLVTAILLVFISFNLFSQDFEAIKKNWRTIQLDLGPDWSTYYKLKHKNLELITTKDSSKTISTVDSTLVLQLFQAIEKSVKRANIPDSSNVNHLPWNREKAQRAWFDFSQYQFDERSNEIAIGILQNFDWNKHKNEIEEYIRYHNRDFRLLHLNISYEENSEPSFISMGSRTPFVNYDLHNDEGYIHFSSFEVYSALQQLFQFPHSKENQEAMECKYIFETEIEDSLNNYWLNLARRRNKKSMQKLEKLFPVREASISEKATIDWGNRKHVTLLLNSHDYKVQYSLTYDYSFLLNLYDYFEPHTFAYKHAYFRGKSERLEDSLLQNPVVNYCENNYLAKGLLHYVRRRSLSFKARRDFKQDFKESGQDKNVYKGKLKHAILFELQEGEHNDLQYHEKAPNVSYWVFLEDGTIILWQSSGDKIMNFPQDFVNRANCKVISKEDFKRYEIQKLNR